MRKSLAAAWCVAFLLMTSCGSSDADTSKAVELVSAVVSDVESWTSRPGSVLDLLDEGKELRSDVADARKALIDLQLDDQTKSDLKLVLTFADDAITEQNVSLASELSFGKYGTWIANAINYSRNWSELADEGSAAYEFGGRSLKPLSGFYFRSTAFADLPKVTSDEAFKQWMIRAANGLARQEEVAAAWTFYEADKSSEKLITNAKEKLASLEDAGN